MLESRPAIAAGDLAGSESLAGDCQHTRSTALNNRCVIYYPQLPTQFLSGKGV